MVTVPYHEKISESRRDIEIIQEFKKKQQYSKRALVASTHSSCLASALCYTNRLQVKILHNLICGIKCRWVISAVCCTQLTEITIQIVVAATTADAEADEWQL